MTKHTPGPWECRPSMEYPWDYEISTPTSEDRGEDPSEAEANARLIAAAPDLLAALTSLYEAYCSAMRSEFDFPGRPWTPERDNDEAALSARAAIQKATKEQV